MCSGTMCSDTSSERARRGPAVPIPGAELCQVAVIRSDLVALGESPRQGSEGAPDAWVEIEPWAADAARGIAVGEEILLVTWFHRARRDVLQVHPRFDADNPLTGVFATRSPHRPNPLGLHLVTVRAIEWRAPDAPRSESSGACRLRVGPLEAIDGTPVVDIKPVL
jgi:tRNA-Thr(GGU) m(6)t(6)A37 methyltransferase TsaA